MTPRIEAAVRYYRVSWQGAAGREPNLGRGTGGGHAHGPGKCGKHHGSRFSLPVSGSSAATTS